MSRRPLAVALALPLVACVDNPYYQKSTESAGSTTGGSSDSSVDSESGSASSSSGQAPDLGAPECVPAAEPRYFPITRDVHLIAAESDGIGLCVIDGEPYGDVPCADKNFDGYDFFDLRFGPGHEAMFAFHVDAAAIAEALAADGQTPLGAEIVVRLWDDVTTAPVKLRVGVILDPWVETHSTFGARSDGVNYDAWGDDGPISGTYPLCTRTLPAAVFDHEPWSICPEGSVELDDIVLGWVADPSAETGLLLYVDRDEEWPADGPGVKAWESGNYEPYVLVYTCAAP